MDPGDRAAAGTVQRGERGVIVIKTSITALPEYCDDCTYYSCSPYPYKGWMNACELCVQCLDDDGEKGWFYDGNDRPENCPLFEVKGGAE